MSTGALIATERLKTILQNLSWDYKKYAETFKIDEARACRIINGKEEPSKQHIKEVYSFFKMEEGLFSFNPDVELVNGGLIKEQ